MRKIPNLFFLLAFKREKKKSFNLIRMSKQQNINNNNSGSTFLPPDVLIKSKLESIWTELQSNLPTISFDLNNEVYFRFLFLFFVFISFIIKDDVDDEENDNVNPHDFFINNNYNDDDDSNDFIIKDSYASIDDFVNNYSDDDNDDDDSVVVNNKSDSRLKNNEIFIKLEKTKLNFDSFNNESSDYNHLKRAESVAKASRITKAMFDQSCSKLNMEIFEHIDIGKGFSFKNDKEL